MTDYDPQAGREMPESATTFQQLEADDIDLQEGLRGLAGMVSGSLGVEELLSEVAGYAAHAVPGACEAGVALLQRTNEVTQIVTLGATADIVRTIDQIQYKQLAEGPCISSMHTGRPMVSGSLGNDDRWPRFGGRVARLGVPSALSLPLVVQGRVIGAINAYSRERDAFSEHAVRLGERFAGPAAVAVHNAQLLVAASTKAAQLQAALTSRAVIDQAIGILRSRTGGSADEAFGRLRQISQSENVKLSLVAQRLVDQAVRRAHARHVGA